MSTTEELHATITARAELDRAFARLLVEESATVMSRNMINVLNQQQRDLDQERQAIQHIVKEAISAALAPLMAEFRRQVGSLESGQQDIKAHVDSRFGELTARLEGDEERLDRKRARLDAHDTEIAELRARLDARPSPEEARATYEGVRRIMDHLGLTDDGTE